MNDNPRAYPCGDQRGTEPDYGMTLRDWFAGQALANPSISTGTAPDYLLRRWFGERGGIMPWEIAAKQAGEYADAMLEARKAKP